MAYLEPVIGGLAFWALGMLWYSPVLFSKAWQEGTGMTDEKMQNGNMAMIFGTSALLMIVMAFGTNLMLGGHFDSDPRFTHGAFHGALFGVFFAAASMGINYLYQRKSIKLWLIDAVYQVLGLALAGGIMAVLQLGDKAAG